MKAYVPYKSDRPDKKYYIITKGGRRVYFGAAGYEDYTMHKDDERKRRYIARHKNNENWENPDTAAYWAVRLLWNKPTIKESYDDIKNDLKKKGYII